MKIDPKIQAILEDIYEHEPDLRQREKELVELVSKLITMRPEVQVDPEFARELRKSILDPASKNINKRVKNMLLQNIQSVFMKNKLILGGLAVAVVVLVVAVSGVLPTFRDTSNLLGLGEIKINKVGSSAFGLLAIADSNPVASSMGAGGDEKIARSQSGGGGAEADRYSLFPAPDYIQYRYIYHGEDLNLPDSSLEVLRRIKGQYNGGLPTALRNLNLGLIDISKFVDSRLQNLSFRESQPGGYQVFIDFSEGMVSLNEYQTDSRVYEQPGFGHDQVPDDSELFALTNRFLEERNISRRAYGEPILMKYWQNWQTISDQPVEAPLSTARPIEATLYDVTITYPLQINGQSVVDQGGGIVGLAVNVRLRDRKVTGIWNLSVQQYEASLYEAETSADRILKIAERGGLYNYYPLDIAPSRVVDIPLGAPKQKLMQFWSFRDGRNDELLIPALVFPVLEQNSSEQYLPEFIVVPLVKEILDQAEIPQVQIFEKRN